MNLKDRSIFTLYKSGLSSKQIGEKLGRSASGVDYILRKNGIQKRTISEAVKHVNVTRFGKEGFLVKKRLSQEEEKLKTMGVVLYWGEGTKGGNTVAIANSDPQIIRVFLKFLRRICGVSESRLRVTMHLYPGHIESTERDYWVKIMGIPSSQFSKAWFHEVGATGSRGKCPHGTVSVRYSDSTLLEIIKSWILEYSGI